MRNTEQARWQSICTRCRAGGLSGHELGHPGARPAPASDRALVLPGQARGGSSERQMELAPESPILLSLLCLPLGIVSGFMLIRFLRISKYSDNTVRMTGLRAWGWGRLQLTPRALGGNAGSRKGRGWRAVGSKVLQAGTLCIRKTTQGQTARQ